MVPSLCRVPPGPVASGSAWTGGRRLSLPVPWGLLCSPPVRARTDPWLVRPPQSLDQPRRDLSVHGPLHSWRLWPVQLSWGLSSRQPHVGEMSPPTFTDEEPRLEPILVIVHSKDPRSRVCPWGFRPQCPLGPPYLLATLGTPGDPSGPRAAWERRGASSGPSPCAARPARDTHSCGGLCVSLGSLTLLAGLALACRTRGWRRLPALRCRTPAERRQGPRHSWRCL